MTNPAERSQDLTGTELSLFRRRVRGETLSQHEADWLDAQRPHQMNMLANMAALHDADDRQVWEEIARYPEGYAWHQTVGGGLPDDWRDAELPRLRPRDWTQARRIRFRVASRRSPKLRGRHRTHGREHRPAAARRTAASSSTSSADPGDPEPPPLSALLAATADTIVGSDWAPGQIDAAHAAWLALQSLEVKS